VNGGGAEVKAVGPGERAHLKKHTRELNQILQRRDHRSVPLDYGVQIVVYHRAVGEGQPQNSVAGMFCARDFNHRRLPG